MDSPSTASVLLLGFALGVRHAVEADHLAAVSAIVSERKGVWGSSLVGGLWGVGHTAALLAAGLALVAFGVRVGGRLEQALEFSVGLMLVALGARALAKLARGGRVHLHVHEHGGRAHAHPHLHDGESEEAPHTHHGLRLDARTLAVGVVHGLAGSAALMLLILSAIASPLARLLYVAVFGLGSVGGMMLMSALVSLPMRLTAARFGRAHLALRCAAGAFSLCCGLSMLYDIGVRGDLFR
jgi:sulfite exporter TauE/SafE